MKGISKKTISITLTVIAITLILGIFLLSNKNENISLPVNSKESSEIKLPIYGEESSANNLILFGDFRCPYCMKWSEEVLPKLVDEYVLSGKLSVTFANLAFVAVDSQTFSKFGLAIANQGNDKYWEFENKVNRYLKEKSIVTEKDLISFAKSELSEIDIAKLEKDLSDEKLIKRLNENIELAKQYGITATPQIVLNGDRITNVSYENIKGLLD